MSLDQYNKLINNKLNERYALAKLRAELEGREGDYVGIVEGSDTSSENVEVEKSSRRRQ